MPDPLSSASDAELRQRVERVLEGHYELDREIGRGGMGIVYLARDSRLKRPVAVKLLPPELAYRPEIRSRFLREAETAAQLSHPNIVPIYTVDEREGLVFFIMGYVDGGNLARRLHEQGPRPPEEVRRILREVADALAYAHARNVVHRDIKPDNILLDRGTGRAMVTDFGIARAVTEGADSRLTATGMAIGTPAYMSPEQSAGEREVDGRSDIYSLGIVAYQLLVGEPPFTASSTPALLVKQLSERPVPVAERRHDVPPDLASCVMRMLEKDPSDRFATAADLVKALDQRQVVPVSSAPAAPAPSASAPVPASATSAPLGVATLPAGDGAGLALEGGPTAEELRRWDAPPVVEFRRKLAPYIAVNSVIVLMAIFNVANFLGLTAVWSVYLAYQYAKLWTEGYDWRDVFKQTRDRLILDVAAETIDEARALWDPQKRTEVRERERRRRLGVTGARPAAGLPAGAPPGTPAGAGTDRWTPTLRRAQADRDEIVRLVHGIPKRDRERLPDVVGSAHALYDRVRELAGSLAELERTAAPGAAQAIDREITALEAQANPLDHAASEERVRRLAYLKRQRRAALDAEQRLQRDAVRLESCATALQNMRLDLVRLKTGAQSYQQVTQLAERAMSLAHEVDGIVMAGDHARSPYGGAGRAAADQV